MNWTELIGNIFTVCILPMLGILTKFLVDFLSNKREEIKAKTDSELARKYTEMIFNTVVNCVVATNQTYVNALKDKGAFDETAQKEAFNRTMEAVLLLLSEEAKQYIIETTGDLNTYLTQLIESQVNAHKK